MRFLILLVAWDLSIILDAFKDVNCSDLPLVLNTWGFARSTSAAWCKLNSNDGDYLEALVDGCSLCEREQCDGTVGFGGSPDESGETTLDAMIMDGSTMNIGAVAGLRNIKDAISVAYHVLKYTRHTMLVGEGATKFAKMMDFKTESLQTLESIKIWDSWNQNECQPNYWLDVIPDPRRSCGPYSPKKVKKISKFFNCEDNSNWTMINEKNHDTIGMIIIDKDGNIGAGTSTNGAAHKIPGRVGDSAIPGSGAYADSNVGAAVSTGDGDIMMRFLPSFLAVEKMHAGQMPEQAAEFAISRIAKYFPNFVGAVIAANKYGQYSAACYGLESFPYSVFKPGYNFTIVNHVKCLKF